MEPVLGGEIELINQIDNTSLVLVNAIIYT